MDTISKTVTIKGKEVTLMIIFDGEFSNLSTLKGDPDFMKKYAKDDADYLEYDEKAYTSAEYSKDFRDFAKYQNHKGFSKDDEERKSELDLKFYNRVKEFQRIPFRTFKKTISSIFEKILFYEIEHNSEHLENTNKPGYLNSDKLTIEIKLLHVKEREFYFYYNYKASDPETMCFYCSGLWFIQTIVAPFFFFGKTDFAYVERFIMHEFRHHLDYINGWLVWDTKFQPIIRRFAKRQSMYAYGILFLYKSLFNLREEGMADFSARINSDKFEINMKGVREYNANLIVLSHWKKEGKSEEYYEDKISSGNSSPSGEYTMGRNILLTIALYFAKEEKKPYTIVFPNGIEHSSYNFTGNVKKIIDKKEVTMNITLNDWLKGDQMICIKNIDKEILNKVKNEVAPAKHHHLIRIYEQACDSLGIEENNRIMTVKRFHKLLQDALQKYKDDKKKRIEEQGFINPDDKPERAVAELDNN